MQVIKDKYGLDECYVLETRAGFLSVIAIKKTEYPWLGLDLDELQSVWGIDADDNFDLLFHEWDSEGARCPSI